jgi:hypothetical protein
MRNAELDATKCGDLPDVGIQTLNARTFSKGILANPNCQLVDSC